jgi:hypothetical protein
VTVAKSKKSLGPLRSAPPPHKPGSGTKGSGMKPMKGNGAC